MQPAAVLGVLVTTEGVGPSNAKLNSVQSTLKKTQAVADSAGASIANTGKRLEKAGQGITKFGRAATRYYAAPLLAAAGASVYFAQKYEKSMLMVQTHTDTNRRNLALYKKEILEMGASGKYVQGPNELAEAMYHIASDGFKGHKAVEMLKKSSELAMVGQSGLAETTYAVVSAMKTQIKGTETSSHTINELNAIVGAGDMKMQEWVGALSTGILPAAKAMGLSLRDVGVAEDIMTQRGVPAQQSAYRLAMTFQMLIPHTEKAEKAFERLGLKNEALIEAMERRPKEGLLAAMQLLERHLRTVEGPRGVDQIQTIEEIFGGGRTSRGAITLLQNLKSVEETYGRINKLSGETPKKIKEAKAAPVNKLKESLVQLETVLTKIGIKLIPPLAEAISNLAHFIENLANWFLKLPHGMQMAIIYFGAITVALALMARLFGPLITGIGQFIGWIGKMAMAEEEVVVGNEAVVASNESVVASNEAVMAAYGETAAAAEASAAAQTAAIEEVAAAQKLAQAEMTLGMPIGGLRGISNMDALIPEAAGAGGQLSLFGTDAAAATSAAAADAGTAAAPVFATGFAAALPAALAAVALPATIAAAVIAPLAIADINAGPEKTKYQKRLGASHRHVSSTHQEMRQDFGRVIETERKLAEMKGKETRANHKLEEAERNLRRARKGLGPDAEDIARAERKVWVAKARVIAKIEEQNHLEKKHGFALQAAKHKAVEAVAANKVEIASLKQYQLHLEKVLGKERDAGAFKHKLTDETKAHLEALNGVESRIKQAQTRNLNDLQKAEQEIGKKWAQKLSEMTLAQAKFGRHYQGLKHEIESNPIKMHDIETKHAEQTLSSFMDKFEGKSQKAVQTSAKFFLGWEKGVSESMGSVGEEVNHMLTAMGQSPVKGFKQASKTHKKMRGGSINVGAASGDSVHAMLEKGEYVMNREAVSKIGVHKLNEINFGKVPRFQLGGSVEVGSANMKVGDEPQILNDLYKLSSEISKIVYVISGYRTPAHSVAVGGFANDPHTRGEAADIGAGAPTLASMFGVKESALKNIGLYRPFYPADAHEVNHVQLFGKQTEGAKGNFGSIAAPRLPAVTLEGPEGKLLHLGQAAINKVHEAGQKYLNQKAGKMGGLLGANVPTGPIVQMAHEMVANIWGSGEWPPFQSLEMQEAGFNPRALNPSSGAAGLAQALPASKYPKGAWPYTGLDSAKLQLQWMMGYIKERYGSPAAAWGHEQSAGWYQKGGPVPIEKTIASTLQGLAKGKNLPAFESNLKKVDRRISSIDIDPTQANKLVELSATAEQYSEYASRASALDVEKEIPGSEGETEIVQGVFGGKDTASWLREELGILFSLRDQLIASHGSIKDKTLPRIMKLLKHTQKRLVAAKHKLHKQEAHKKAYEKAKRELEKHNADLEKAQNDNIHKLEKEKNELEQKLNQAQNAKTPDKELINRIRSEIKSKNDAMNESNSRLHTEIKKDNEQINDYSKKVNKLEKVSIPSSERVIGGAEEVIKTLQDKQSNLYEAASSMFGAGGTFEGKTKGSFYGLDQIQGKVPNYGPLSNPANFSVGGEIFDIELELKKLGEEAQKVRKRGPTSAEEELKELEKEIELEWRKRFIVSQEQFKVLSQFPSVGSVASVPYAGEYATGGLVAATVGERGREVAVMPHGSRIVPEHDAKDAIAQMAGASGINFEEVHFHEAEQKVSGRANGEDFEAHVKKITRKQSRDSMSQTPGGRRLLRP